MQANLWRTLTQQEIDYIEEVDGVFHIFEMKWNPKKANTKTPKSFTDAYHIASSTIITPDNYLEYLI